VIRACPQEGTAETIQSGDHSEGQLHGAHGESGQSIENGIQSIENGISNLVCSSFDFTTLKLLLHLD
jgi:hypothetical protein